MNATMKIPPEKLSYRGEPTREAHITDEELRMIEAGEKAVKPTGRVALKGNLTWAEEDDEKLIGLSKQGLSEKAISIEMHRSKGSIETRLHYLRKQKNLTCQRITKPWTAEEDEMVASAYKSGKSVPEICAETGRTKDSVVHRLQKLSKTGAFEMRPRGKRGRREKKHEENVESGS